MQLVAASQVFVEFLSLPVQVSNYLLIFFFIRRRRHSSDNPVATEDSDNESDNERADHPNKASLQAQPSICWNSRLYIQFERASNRRQQKPQYQTVQTAVV